MPYTICPTKHNNTFVVFVSVPWNKGLSAECYNRDDSYFLQISYPGV